MYNKTGFYALPLNNKDKKDNETCIFRSSCNFDKELDYKTKGKTMHDFIIERQKNKDFLLLGERL